MYLIRRIFRVDPRIELKKGQKAFDQRNFKSALKSFEKAFKRLSNVDMQIMALDNAALCAEKASLFEKATELYYQLILLKLSHKTTKPSRLVMSDINRAMAVARLSPKPIIPISKFLLMKFLIFLGENDLDKLIPFYEKLNHEVNDEYKAAIDTTWELIHTQDTYVQKKPLPEIDLPREFLSVRQEAEHFMQRLSLCQVTSLTLDNSKSLEKGTPFSISGSFTVHAELAIVSISLRIGSHGRIVSSNLPQLPITMTEGASQMVHYSLIPNLPGKWTIGPLTVVYRIPADHNTSQEYSVVSKTLIASIKEAPPALQLSMVYETMEEDHEYTITISAENIGKTSLQDLKIILEIPDGVELGTGTEQKTIGILGQGEVFSYELKVQFSMDRTHFEGHILKAAGYIQNKRLAKCSLKIGGS
ncbi:MAG: hypothetical protein ACFFE8_00550 [Candidatus Heimdallarchaeota archaeon]